MTLKITKAIRQEIGRTYFEKLRNKQVNDYINDWRNLFFRVDGPTVEIEIPYASGTGFTYAIRKTPVFANIMRANSNAGIVLHESFPTSLLYFSGIQYPEPDLVFSGKHTGMTQHPTDFHPMRGISTHRPYDHRLVGTLYDATIRLGVICPKPESMQFSAFLKRSVTRVPTNGKNADYLIEYPGFFEAYGVSLNIPDIATEYWVDSEEPRIGYSVKETALDLKNKIVHQIDGLVSDGVKKVVVICIPDRWLDFCSYDIENEHFDLHDYIKAYCAEKSIATQFIREDTLSDPLHCQISWWLSLSYYVKSLRTPWVLNSFDKDTAFAGIGYSVTRKSASTEIVLGCSHIYNAYGQGLKYRLSKVEDQLVWDRLERPHLSYDDSYRFGMSIIDLFYTTMNELPRRVVVHKRNYFMESEIEGLRDSLIGNGIRELDLIEISFEDDIRFLAGTISQDGRPDIQGFPVSRGTCILLNRYEALLWTHGVVPSVKNPNYKYYLGGRYIPGPLKITKHHGTSNIGMIANEILGLTKVNWNSFDMYSQLPATVSSSNEIARIGRLLSRKEGANYDYRYFI